ncbi:hypothetical protein V9K67_06785 [Paraflavisolibacter sp. H34]|uniref:hypothetical protein n=1 Tax=Huijunlia imazamoxiresistens TaxID=3127457 RepID=UPI0030158F83
MYRRILWVVLWACALPACRNGDAPAPRAPARGVPAPLFLDFSVEGGEGEESVTCLFRFRRGHKDGVGQPLEGEGEVQLDGEVLTADTASFTGTYYEAIRPAEGFAGTHELVFTDAAGERHVRKFRFAPFRLAAELPPVVHRKPFRLPFASLPDGLRQLHLVLVDTALASGGVNQYVPLVDDALQVTPKMLQHLKSGPVSLYLAAEVEQSLKEPGGPRGRLVIRYSLKRAFELAD